ncbi:MAG: hypothetical protein GY856_11670 [bacterium]|nr:hypothetical protein [bacterium]
MTRARFHRTMRVAGCMALAGCLGTGAAFARPQFDYPFDPEFLVVRYDQVHESIAESDNVLRLSIYGDGRVEIHFPFYLRRSGDFELWLSRSELDELLVELERNGVLDFDPERVRERRDQAEAVRRAREGTLVEVTSFSRIEIEIALRSYTCAEGAAPETDLRRKVSWRSLGPEARLYPELTELRDLAAAEKVLLELLERRDLVRKTDGRTTRLGEQGDA